MEFTAREWAVLSELLDEALELNGAELEDWLRRLPESCPVPEPILRDLLLNKAKAETGEWLHRLPIVLEPMENSSISERMPFGGKIVGAYRLIRELGEGGMGSVWLAERMDGILNRPVAIKLPHAGVYSRHFLERFRREREILAGLTHPNIGRLYDAGATGEGEPFLVLEYVEGMELIAYCDREQLIVRARLKLFLQVLNAVHYANAHLVIHRDLKPSNILVDGDGQVKLLDFGIARLILDSDSNRTDLTNIAGQALTPVYASPEQILGEPVSTASDVYSLGVVLCELLTGERPYRKSASRAALEEAVTAGDIVPPSQLAQSPEKASARGATARQLTRALKGDLDTIALKALSRQPHGRYATADAFAQDIHRYLRGLPVLAQPESVWYRSKKFVSRNRLSAASGVGVVLALAAGLTAALWQARRANEQAAAAEAVLEFIEGIFRANSSSQNDPVKARQTTARQLLDIGAGRLDTTLNNVPAAKMRILSTLNNMYSDLDLWDRQIDLDRKRVALARTMYSPNDPALADILLELAEDASNQDLNQEAEKAIREAGQILDRQRDFTSQRRARLESARADVYLDIDFRKAREYSHLSARLARNFPASSKTVDIIQGTAYFDLEAGDYRAAEAVAAEALRAAKSIGVDGNFALAWIHKHLAEAEDAAEDLQAAAQNYGAARELARKYFDAQGAQIRLLDFDYADFLARTSRIREGLAIARPTFETALTLSGQGVTSSLLQSGMIAYASSLIEHGRFEEGLAVLRQAEETRAHLPPALKNLNIQLDEVRATGFIESGRYREAEALLNRAAAIYSELNMKHTPSYSRNVLMRAWLFSVTGRNDSAVETLTAYEVFPVPAGRVSRSKLDEWILRSEIALSTGDFHGASRLAEEARNAVVSSPQRLWLALWEARAALAEGKAAILGGNARDARPLLEQAVTIQKQLSDPTSPAIADAEIALSNCYIDLHRIREASALLASAKAILAKRAVLGPHHVKPLAEIEQRLRSP